MSGNFSSFKEAEIVCENDSNCGGIYCKACNKNQPVSLCTTNSSRWENSTQGCVYQKVTSKMLNLKEYDIHPIELYALSGT